MSRLPILLAAALLAGCAPTVVGGNERSVVIEVNGFNERQAFAVADTHCKQFGRQARQISADYWSPNRVFDCVQ